MQTHPAHRDPVFMNEHAGWCFYNDDWTGFYGPWPTEGEARAKLQEYLAWLESQRVEPAAEGEAKPQSETDVLVAEFLTLRDRKAELAAKHKEEMSEVTGPLDKAEGLLLGKLQDMGVTSFKAGGATITTTTREYVNTKDSAALHAFIQQTGSTELLGNKASTTAVREWRDAHGGELPPGITTTHERTLSVRTS
jgi:hypothetical protein